MRIDKRRRDRSAKIRTSCICPVNGRVDQVSHPDQKRDQQAPRKFMSKKRLFLRFFLFDRDRFLSDRSRRSLMGNGCNWRRIRFTLDSCLYKSTNIFCSFHIFLIDRDHDRSSSLYFQLQKDMIRFKVLDHYHPCDLIVWDHDRHFF